MAKFPASTTKNGIDEEGNLEEEEGAMENAELNDRSLKRRLGGGFDEKERAVELVRAEVRLL